MMDAKELDAEMKRFEGPFLESADLMSCPPVKLTIADVHPPSTVKSADGRMIDKPILVFEKTDRQMIVNKTNQRILKAMFGAKASGWIGHPVSVGVRYLSKAFGQTNVPTLRIIPPAGASIPFSAMKHMGSEAPVKA